MKISALYVLCSSATVALAFAPPLAPSARANNAAVGGASSLSAEPFFAAAAVEESAEEQSVEENVSDTLRIPLSYDEMISQASSCMSDAYAKGMNRQIVRVLLPRDASADRLGVQFEADAEMTDRTMETKLVPTDESWQGGIMQLYRAAAPTAKDVLRRLCPAAATTGVPPKIVEDRSIDESGVDGVGLLYTGGDDNAAAGDNSGAFGLFGGSATLPTLAENDMAVFVQPTQETADAVVGLTSKTESPLIALFNPQWRDVDDALDSASKSGGVLGAFASFLGGKGGVLSRLDELGYRPTFTLEGYVCKGGNIRLMKRFDSDWVVFAENDSGDQYVRVGSTTNRPSYQDVEKMLDDKGVGYKYARDLGMAPKL
eukprot:CAMPEP_0172549504 /NCGR_PEP_ID=MMETSP1067-20121228/18567_1 /TAXON_ID=265564 ORGANISM="Thalassiosira punctigera, Strain Tpunct2005C2" /NCGR_SAMPLE_ID=MMETSP1067 /ASSEMBLY_ACC=CAM_ASM_000444 /LENGTH=371 /DNA_ID=CAMNT_0013336895 /DNA_START=38 /DNA_END=1153 /DNA_ORIENTATION=-